MKTRKKQLEAKSHAVYRRGIDKTTKVGEEVTSDYDSDGGTNYTPYKYLSSGKCDSARVFRAESGGKVVVLKPVDPQNVQMPQARYKCRFFKKIYPKKQAHHFEWQEPIKDYRDVLTYFPGYDFTAKTQINTLQKFIIYSLGALRSVQRAHHAKMVNVDINEGNFIYTPSSYKPEVHIIDGGDSRIVGEYLDKKYSVKKDEYLNFRGKFSQIAPEAISTKNKSKRADYPIDYYAFADMIETLLENIEPNSPLNKTLVFPFLNHHPHLRPSLKTWEARLMACEYIFITTLNQIKAISTDCSECKTRDEVNECSQAAQQKMSDLLCSEVFLSKCKMLDMEKEMHPQIHDVCFAKSQEIILAAGNRIHDINNEAGVRGNSRRTFRR